MVGLIESVAHITRSAFSHMGDRIVLLGEPTTSIGASEYLQRIHGVVAGAPPECDLAGGAGADRCAARGHWRRASSGRPTTAATADWPSPLPNAAIMERGRQMGARVDLSAWQSLPLRALLFGEAQARVVVSTPEAERVVAIARKHGVPARDIGLVDDGGRLMIRVGARELSAALTEARRRVFRSDSSHHVAAGVGGR